MQNTAMHQEERHEEASDASVSVHEGMNRLELRMGNSYVDENRKIVLPVEEQLEVAQRLFHLRNRRRHESCVLDRSSSCRRYEVLVPPKFTRLLLRASHALKQLRVNLTEETKRQGEVSKPIEAVVHRGHVVDDFIDVLREGANAWLELYREQILECALRAFNLRAQDGFASHVHRNEQVWVRHVSDLTVEPADGDVRPRQQRRHRGEELNGWLRRQRCRNERSKATRLRDIASRTSPGV